MLKPGKWTMSSKTDNSGPWCVEVLRGTDNSVTVRDSEDRNGPAVTFKAESWRRFVAGVKSDEFDL
jgi:hypothetical protein